MMLSEDVDKVIYIADMPYDNYDEAEVLSHLEWIETCEADVVPTGRYFMLKRHMCFRGGHLFLVGFTELSGAIEFHDKWKYPVHHGRVEDGKFVREEGVIFDD